MYFTLSNGRPFTPLVFTIQPIQRHHSAARLYMALVSGDFELLMNYLC